MYEVSELLPQLLLRRWCSFCVRSFVEASARDFRGKPIGFGESDCEGYEVFLDLLL